jgi:ribosome-associated protein YbcJ (S4-like RNA binding protein)
MPTMRIQGNQITLAQALKSAGVADSGGQAKFMVRHERIKLNGAVVSQPGKKLHAGDRFQADDGEEWIIEGS